jgi:hypothetical protein
MKSLIILIALPFSLFAQKTVKLTLHNGSLQSIPLVIPGVMNPNLTPLSKSNVELETGQEVFYVINGNKRNTALLFVVGEQFKDGDVLEIDALIKEKNKQLKK